MDSDSADPTVRAYGESVAAVHSKQSEMQSQWSQQRKNHARIMNAVGTVGPVHRTTAIKDTDPFLHHATRFTHVLTILAVIVGFCYILYCLGAIGAEQLIVSNFGVPWTVLRSIEPFVLEPSAKTAAHGGPLSLSLPLQPPVEVQRACCATREALLRTHFTSERLLANGLDVGDLVFSVLPRKDWVRTLGLARCPHAMLFVGAVPAAAVQRANPSKSKKTDGTRYEDAQDVASAEYDTEARFVHLSENGFRYSRMARIWDMGGTLYIRKLRCPPEARAKLLEAAMQSVATQTPQGDPSPLTLAATSRGARIIFGLKDRESSGYTCTTSLFSAMTTAGILTRPVKEFWSPHDTMFEPHGEFGALPWADGCSLDPVKRWVDISNSMEL